MTANVVIFATAMFAIYSRETAGASAVGMVLSFMMQVGFSVDIKLSCTWADIGLSLCTITHFYKGSHNLSSNLWDYFARVN